MNIKVTKEQAEWIIAMTGKDSMQEAVDFFIECMRKEGIPANEILNLMDKMIKKGVKPQ